MKRNTPLSRHIGKKVRQYREQAGWSQELLAAKLQLVNCDLSRVAVGHIELGRRGTSVYEIDKLAEVLGVDYNALFAQDE